MILLQINPIFAEELFEYEIITQKENIKVKLEIPEIHPDEVFYLKVSFYNSTTGKILSNNTVNYDVEIVQNHLIIERSTDQNDSKHSFEVLFAEGATGPAEIIVRIKSIESSQGTISINEKLVFPIKVISLYPLENTQPETVTVFQPTIENTQPETVTVSQSTIDMVSLLMGIAVGVAITVVTIQIRTKFLSRK